MSTGNEKSLLAMFFGLKVDSSLGQKEEKSIKSGQMELVQEIILSPADETAKFLREKAMGILLISEKISSYMNFEALINSRVVSKFWAELATYELSKRKCCRIKISTSDLCKMVQCYENSDLMVVPFPVPLPNSLELDISFSPGWKKDLECLLSASGVQTVQDLFPHVNHLSLRNTKKLDEFLPNILQIWSSLESLTLNICLNKLLKSRGRNNTMEYFDKLLSGVPRWRRELVSDLARSKREGKDFNVKLQELPSLQRLIGLKNLQINLVFDYANIIATAQHGYWPISGSSCRILKILNPDLKIIIGCDERLQILLTPIAPFVEFVEH